MPDAPYIQKAMWTRVAMAVKDGLESLRLKGIPGGQYRLQRLPKNRNAWTAGSFIVPTPERFRDPTNCSDDVGLGIQVAFIMASNQTNDWDEAADQFMYWRERALGHFLPAQGEALPGTPVHTIEYEPGAIFDQAAYDANFDAQAFILRCWYTKPRQTET